MSDIETQLIEANTLAERLTDALQAIRKITGDAGFNVGGPIEHCGAADNPADAKDLLLAAHEYLKGVSKIAEAALNRNKFDRPSDDELWDYTLRQRDSYHEWADSLAEGIAKHLGIDIGEHSNANLPWENALAALESQHADVPESPAQAGPG